MTKFIVKNCTWVYLTKFGEIKDRLVSTWSLRIIKMSPKLMFDASQAEDKILSKNQFRLQ